MGISNFDELSLNEKCPVSVNTAALVTNSRWNVKLYKWMTDWHKNARFLVGWFKFFYVCVQTKKQKKYVKLLLSKM